MFNFPSVNKANSLGFKVDGTTATAAGSFDSKGTVFYGRFCSGLAKTDSFLGSVAVNAPKPSWVAKYGETFVSSPTQVLSYKLDVTVQDVASFNTVASTCLSTCQGVAGCRWASYGYEAGSYFCKMYGVGATTSPCNQRDFWVFQAPVVAPISQSGQVRTMLL